VTTQASPKVTVLMPVYNGASYLSEAMRSILSQSFADFEFLVIDDGSTDDSASIVQGFQDPRIRLVHNGSNLGLVASLNKGMALAAGQYLARMDADDISRPTRLAQQVRFMDEHPGVGVCGSWVRFIPKENDYIWKLPGSSQEIRCWLFSGVGVAHPSVMMRRELFVRHGLQYDPSFTHIEDYELWGRAIRFMDFANIQEVLLDYRISPEQVCTRHEALQLATVVSLRAERLRELGIDPSRDEQRLHEAIVNGKSLPDADYLERAERWLVRLETANRAAGLYQADLFAKRLLGIWFSVCLSLSGTGRCSWQRCQASALWAAAGASLWPRARALAAWMTRKKGNAVPS